MVTLYFTREFTKGILNGLTHNDKLQFVSAEAAMEWYSKCKDSKKLDYRIIDRSFQCYFR